MQTRTMTLGLLCGLCLFDTRPMEGQIGLSLARVHALAKPGYEADAMQGTASLKEQDLAYRFSTPKYRIEMTVSFFDPYLGRRLVFASSTEPGKEVCYSAGDGTTGKCVEKFVGAVAVVRYSVKLVNRRTPQIVTIRERVTVPAQSSDLPAREPFLMEQKLVKGIGSDIQAFGYDEDSVVPADRPRVRADSQATSWRLCKQELYVDQETKPFAIVEWKHTLSRISVVRIYSPIENE